MDLTKSQEEKLRKIIADGVPKSLTLNGQVRYISKKTINKVKEQEKKEGGILPLAALLPIIIAGLGTAAGVTTGIVKAVKDSNEQKRHHHEMERIAKEGKGFDAIKKFVKATNLDEESKKLLKQILFNIADTIDIGERKKGNGIYLEPKGSGIFLNP